MARAPETPSIFATTPIVPVDGAQAEFLSLPLAERDLRDRALPIRPGDLIRLLQSETPAEGGHREMLGKLGHIVGALFHSEFYEKLRELKERYAPLDPDSDYVAIPPFTRARTEDSDEQFLAELELTLEKANYRRLDLGIIEQAVSAPNELGLNYVPNLDLFEHLYVFARGYTQVSRTFRTARTRFRKRSCVLEAYQRLVVILKFKGGVDHGPFVRSDVLYLRMFKDVPHVDMEMHLPEQGTRVKMRWIDRAQIASPLATGLPLLGMKILLGLTTPFAIGALMVPISAGVNSFFGFQRAKQKHLSHMIRSLYYQTLANNASVLTRLVDTAEDEEYKETLLAYFFLWRVGEGCEVPDRDALDTQIEQFLHDRTGISINFEIGDALEKLLRLGLARRDALGRLRATPIDEALAHLDRLWDDTFRYEGDAATLNKN